MACAITCPARYPRSGNSSTAPPGRLWAPLSRTSTLATPMSTPCADRRLYTSRLKMRVNLLVFHGLRCCPGDRIGRRFRRRGGARPQVWNGVKLCNCTETTVLTAAETGQSRGEAWYGPRKGAPLSSSHGRGRRFKPGRAHHSPCCRTWTHAQTEAAAETAQPDGPHGAHAAPATGPEPQGLYTQGAPQGARFRSGPLPDGVTMRRASAAFGA